MNDMFKDIKKFHEAFGHPAPMQPQMLDETVAELRIELIEEEFTEFKDAIKANDPVAMYDAIIDLLVVVTGTAVAAGMDTQPGWDEVRRSNMSKLGADGKAIISRGEELDGYPVGKILKGPNYFNPDLKKVLTAMGLGINIHESHNMKDTYTFRSTSHKTLHCGDCWVRTGMHDPDGVERLELPCTALPGNKEIKR
jgi:predicted HAD superfamily Cof-like phosphohydrolase